MMRLGIALLLLYKRMRLEVPQAFQPWFADDSGVVGQAEHSTQYLAYLMNHGPKYGYYPLPENSWYICKVKDEAVAKEAFATQGLKINCMQGQLTWVDSSDEIVCHFWIF